jgi:CheY-like chemotaxis protein
MRQLGFNGLVIGVTGCASPEDIRVFTQHGANHVLTKPLKIARLLELLRAEGLI